MFSGVRLLLQSRNTVVGSKPRLYNAGSEPQAENPMTPV